MACANCLRRPWFPWLAALFVRGSGLKLLVRYQTMGEGAAEQEAKEAEELVNRAEDRADRIGSWQ